MIYSNMRLVVLDSRGRLLEFQWVPPQIEGTRGSETNADAPSPWPALFEAAGLDLAAFVPATSLWAPASYADTRLAWEGPGPAGGDARLRVEAEGSSYTDRDDQDLESLVFAASRGVGRQGGARVEIVHATTREPGSSTAPPATSIGDSTSIGSVSVTITSSRSSTTRCSKTCSRSGRRR